MTVMVAGGAGFLGSWVCEKLLNAGYRVLCIDNLNTGSVENIEHMLEDDNFMWRKHDVRDADLLDIAPGPLTHIMNFAAPASPVAYAKDPIYTIETCFMGTRNLAKRALLDDAVFFQASTSEVYGDPVHMPQLETYWGNVNPTGPRACYDEGKRAAEALLFDFGRRDNLRLKVARIFNTYGPRMHPDDGRVVSNFIVQALQGKPMTVHGDGTQTRAFCYVHDMVEGIMKFVFETEEFTGPVNLGNPVDMSVNDLAALVIDIVGTDAQVKHQKRPVDDPEMRRPDIKLAMAKFGWSPMTSVSVGVSDTVAYFRHRLGIQENEE